MVRGDAVANRCDDGSVTHPLESVYSAWTAHVAEATSDRLARPSRAAAWTVKELLLHPLLDARRAPWVVIAMPIGEWSVRVGDGVALACVALARIAAIHGLPRVHVYAFVAVLIPGP